jgi:FlaA1/EpsC-like NDP-sugar epimerase
MAEPPALVQVPPAGLPPEEASGRLCRLAPPRIDGPLEQLGAERILVTGAAGSIGTAAQRALGSAGIEPLITDLRGLDGSRPLDVRDSQAIEDALGGYRPTLVLHLAGAKSAPVAETDVHSALEVNAWGTATLVAAAGRAGARVVTASTCKACDPETVYGATKLLAERLTIAAGGSVARFYNVVESSGNVFETWRVLPPDEPLPVTPCSRYLISLADATALLLWAAVLRPGRYTIDPGEAWTIAQIAAELYPGRPQREILPRRGDRTVEPRCARSETIHPFRGRIERIVNRHDLIVGETGFPHEPPS